MNREQIAAELAERVGRCKRFTNDPINAHWNERFEPKVVELTRALNELERAGLIVLVTDDVAVFKFPVEGIRK